MTTVLYVMTSQHFSGAEIVMERLMLANQKRVRPIVLCPSGAFAQRLRERGVDVVEEPALGALDRGLRRYTRVGLSLHVGGKVLRVTRRVMAILRAERPAVVHANNLAAAVYLLPALMLARLHGRSTRWIWSNHDLAYPHGRFSSDLARLCHRSYERTIAVSNAVRERYVEYQDRIDLLYNGLDSAALALDADARTRFRQQWGLGEHAIAIGIVGTIEEGKGHHLLVEAFGTIAARWPDATLFIIGRFGAADAGYEAHLRSIVEHHGGGRVMFTGRLEGMRDVYCGLDIVVNATTSRRGEPLGTTIYEAMACERLVIATRTGGSPEIIEDGIDGYLCAPDSSAALAEILERALSSLSSSSALRAAARRTVMNRFSIDRMCDEYNDILAHLGTKAALEPPAAQPAVIGD